jgi:diadenosine tetraphosphate (Ap4A) HIT family hydrolase
VRAIDSKLSKLPTHHRTQLASEEPQAAMNPTIEKFGYPATLLRDFEHWLVLLRPAQVTLGSLVLAAKSDAMAYSELPREAFAEQAEVVKAVEKALSSFCRYERINYLMLMMVDPNVHFHVIPRYSAPREWNGVEFADGGWPGPPQFGNMVALTSGQIAELALKLSSILR